MPVHVRCSYEDIKVWKWAAVQAGRQKSLGRPGRWSFSPRGSQSQPFRPWRRRGYQLVPVDLIFPSSGALRRTEGGDLIEHHNFDALARFSISERTLRAAGTPDLLRRAFPFCADHHRSDVANVFIGQRHGSDQVNWVGALMRVCL